MSGKERYEDGGDGSAFDPMSRASDVSSENGEVPPEPVPETATRTAQSPLMRGLSALPLLFEGVPVAASSSSQPRSPESQTVKLRLGLLGISSDAASSSS